MKDTDKIKVEFDNWLHLSQTHCEPDEFTEGEIDVMRLAFIDAYRQGQRDLIEAMGEPVAWVRRHPDGGLTERFIAEDDIETVRKQSGAWVPLYRLPEDAQK